MKKKIALTLTTLGLAFALSACNNATTRTNQTGYNTHGTRIQTNTHGVYDPRNAMLDNKGWNNTGVRNGYQTYTAPNGVNRGTGTVGNTGINRYSTYGNTNNTNTVRNEEMGTYRYSIYKPNNSSATTNQFRPNSSSQQPRVGYAHFGEGTGMSAKGNSAVTNAAQNVYVDRQMLANAIAGVAKTIPEVKNISVLTTDNQAIVGCNTKGLNANQAKTLLQKVQSQTSSICPRYYKVYTSNNQNVIDKVHRNAGSFVNKTDGEIEKIIGQK
ncbi:MAG TPA: hypothetical protein DDY49_09095 [Paenibacillaceae bacterium]|nr:hypothetical protein [Paenibacillaceae bacterium]